MKLPTVFISMMIVLKKLADIWEHIKYISEKPATKTASLLLTLNRLQAKK